VDLKMRLQTMQNEHSKYRSVWIFQQSYEF